MKKILRPIALWVLGEEMEKLNKNLSKFRLNNVHYSSLNRELRSKVDKYEELNEELMEELEGVKEILKEVELDNKKLRKTLKENN